MSRNVNQILDVQLQDRLMQHLGPKETIRDKTPDVAHDTLSFVSYDRLSCTMSIKWCSRNWINLMHPLVLACWLTQQILRAIYKSKTNLSA